MDSVWFSAGAAGDRLWLDFVEGLSRPISDCIRVLRVASVIVLLAVHKYPLLIYPRIGF